MVENVTRLLSPRLLILEAADEARVRINLAGTNETKIFARVGNPTQGQCVQSAGEEGATWLELAAIARPMANRV
jgi:hypothetical protein